MKYSHVQKTLAPDAISEPDATPGDHYCIGSNCPKCRRGRNRISSHPDRLRTPNHYYLGSGCPKCNPTPNKRALSTWSLPTSPSHSVTSHDESSLFSGQAHFSDSEVPLASTMHSEPEPPHQCRWIPCKVCGRRYF